jgi:hypothetical protein
VSEHRLGARDLGAAVHSGESTEVARVLAL